MVNPTGLSALIALTGAITEGTPCMVTGQGSGCQSIGTYVFREGEAENPRAVLGNIDLSARYTMRDLIPAEYPCYIFPGIYSLNWNKKP